MVMAKAYDFMRSCDAHLKIDRSSFNIRHAKKAAKWFEKYLHQLVADAKTIRTTMCDMEFEEDEVEVEYLKSLLVKIRDGEHSIIVAGAPKLVPLEVSSMFPSPFLNHPV